MTFTIHFSFAFITMVGLLFGHMFRCEHSLKPLNETILIVWPIVSIAGLLFTNMIPLFYFMNMVTIGWIACDYTLHAFNLRT